MPQLVIGNIDHDYTQAVDELAAEFTNLGYDVDRDLIAILYMVDARNYAAEVDPFSWADAHPD